jgi:hypothetical protein
LDWILQDLGFALLVLVVLVWGRSRRRATCSALSFSSASQASALWAFRRQTLEELAAGKSRE